MIEITSRLRADSVSFCFQFIPFLEYLPISMYRSKKFLQTCTRRLSYDRVNKEELNKFSSIGRYKFNTLIQLVYM